MTPEQMERAIEFVLTQQAQFVTDLGLMREVQATFQSQLNTMGETMSAVVSVVGGLAQHQRQADERLAQSREDTDRRFAEVAETQREVAETQREMGERVNLLIGVVERYFSGRNGDGRT